MRVQLKLCRRLLPILTWALLGGYCPTSYAQSEKLPSSIEIFSYQDGSDIIIQVQMYLKADIETVWSTITDYQHATQFISNLSVSKEEKMDVNTKKITQVGKVGWEPFLINLQTSYSVFLNPENKTIIGKLISGDVKSMTMKSNLLSDVQGNTTLHYSVAIEPMPYIPKIFAEKILLSHTRQSFSDLANEIEKRSMLKKESGRP